MNRHVEITDNTLVIVKSDLIGDYILFRNFLPYIKQSEKYKNYKIILIGNAVWKNIAETLDATYYDEMIWVSFDRLYNDLSYRSSVIKNILSKGYKTLFYPVYSGDRYAEQFFISKINAEEKIKYLDVSSDTSDQNGLFNVLLKTKRPDLFEVYRYKEMMETFLGTPDNAFQWRTLYSPTHVPQYIFPKPYVVFFPGSSARLKRWHPSNFIHVANHLMKHSDYNIVLAGGKKDSKYAAAITSGIEEQYRNRLEDLTGKTSLMDLAYTIGHSELLVTNDSVSIHMAAATNVPAICVFMGENYGRFAPYPKEIYDKGVFLCPPDVEELVKQEEGKVAFLSLDYNPDIDAISPARVIVSMEEIWSKKQKEFYLSS
ncbi:MAG TPA: glycosyltransferase family 9 protein [Cytophagaceae bacterium]|nr:glycosyltransferase family 9 protein [Cytophagaceae bacterium]